MQSGAPSHVDLFDYKPLLAKLRGQEIPASVSMGQQSSTMTAGKGQPCLGAIAPIRQHGKCGAWVSDFLPHTAGDRRRPVLREVDADRRRQSRPRDDVPPHRRHAAGPAQHGRLALLRPGQRERRPADVLRDDLPRSRRLLRPDLLRLLLGQRLSPHEASGRAVPQRRRSGALPFQPHRA